jgi:hypothetical protein
MWVAIATVISFEGLLDVTYNHAYTPYMQAGRKALRAAFKVESYGRRVATAKPLLTETQKQMRLAWATGHLSWKPEQWARIIWTDECSFSTEGFGRAYVTGGQMRNMTRPVAFPSLEPAPRGQFMEASRHLVKGRWW